MPLRVAVMGCVVNGPGEAREADLGVASGNGKGQIFVKGEVVKTVPESQIVETLIEEALRIAEGMEPVDGSAGERHRQLTARPRGPSGAPRRAAPRTVNFGCRLVTYRGRLTDSSSCDDFAEDDPGCDRSRGRADRHRWLPAAGRRRGGRRRGHAPGAGQVGHQAHRGR